MNKTSFILLLMTVLGVLSCTAEDSLTGLPQDTGMVGSYGNYSSGIITQWMPVNVFVRIRDKQGADLLDPERNASYYPNASIEYKGKVYPARQAGDIGSRAYQATIYGYYLINQGGWMLMFGEIDGAADLDEDLILRWPDGSKDIIHYHCGKHNPKTMTCERTWKLNGVSASNPFILIK